MKPTFLMRAPPVDAAAIQATIQRALTASGLDTESGPMRKLTDTIQQALSSAGLVDRGAPPATPPCAADLVIDVDARVVGMPPAPADKHDRSAAGRARSRFETHCFTHRAGTRSYKLYVPAQTAESPPMLVMLHGCTQSPDDFATGTRMNELADVHGFVVLYPEQSTAANPSKCWSWFNPQDQRRDTGEPSLLAAMVRKVAQQHGVDGKRIFVAGLSAGAAMAVVLGETHPDLFAAVGVHSGLPFGSAHDVPSAMAAMKGGRGRIKPQPRGRAMHPVRTIVFHGDRDHTVRSSNGVEIVEQAAAAHPGCASGRVERIEAAGRTCSKTVYTDAAGRSCLESWVVHGAGHAWAGGNAAGSFTDASGPDASAEMVRFFLQR